MDEETKNTVLKDNVLKDRVKAVLERVFHEKNLNDSFDFIYHLLKTHVNEQRIDLFLERELLKFDKMQSNDFLEKDDFHYLVDKLEDDSK